MMNIIINKFLYGDFGESGSGEPAKNLNVNNDMSFAVTSESSDSSDFCYEKIEGNKYFHEDKLVNLVKTE